MAKPAPKKRTPETADVARNPISTDTRMEKKPQGRPKETAEPRRHYHFQLEESVADLFDELAEQHRMDTNTRSHGSAKRFLVHLIKNNK